MKEQILNEIAEKVMVNLAKHEVELSLVDDLKAKADLAEKEQKAFIDAYKIIISESAKAIEQGSKYVNNGKELDSLLTKFQTQAKELGLNYNDNAVYKKAENILVRGDIDAVMQKVLDLRKLK
jgi:uncharacterized FlgJ-related protein